MIHIMTLEYINKRSLYHVTKDGTDKPIIYTFYSTIDPSIKHTGMTDSADESLLQVWKEKWTEAGWDARLLNLDDAKRHPKFSEFDEKLQKISLNGPNEYYNQLCYYRWLAMAEVGGGWMSDYDVLPMNIHGHNHYNKDGNFTVYGGSAPCLMSGSESEWERMAFLILENGIQQRHAKLWSDMFAIVDLFTKDTQVYQLYNFVGYTIVNIKWNAQSCHHFKNKLATHFSHHAMNEIKLADINMRPDFAKTWIEKWKSGCDSLTTS